MWPKSYLMLNFSPIIACAALVMMLLWSVTINKYATRIKLIKLQQQINDRFDINNKLRKFCSGSFFKAKVVMPYIVCSRPIQAI